VDVKGYNVNVRRTCNKRREERLSKYQGVACIAVSGGFHALIVVVRMTLSLLQCYSTGSPCASNGKDTLCEPWPLP